MIGPKVQALLLENKEKYLIPADNVATVLYNHPLEHALLVLSKIGYAKIPVLNSEDRLVGLVSLSNIVNKMTELSHFDLESITDLTVADVMEVNVSSIHLDTTLEEVLRILVEYSFLPVVDDDNVFLGIVTRKEVLKSVNFLVHEVEKRYELIEKE